MDDTSRIVELLKAVCGYVGELWERNNELNYDHAAIAFGMTKEEYLEFLN